MVYQLTEKCDSSVKSARLLVHLAFEIGLTEEEIETKTSKYSI